MKASREAGNRVRGPEGERERMTESSFWREGAKGLNKERINERVRGSCWREDKRKVVWKE